MSEDNNPSLKLGAGGGVVQVEVQGGENEDLEEVTETAYEALEETFETHKKLVEHEDSREDGDNGGTHSFG